MSNSVGVALLAAGVGLSLGMLIPKPEVADLGQLFGQAQQLIYQLNTFGVAAMVARVVLLGQCLILFRFASKWLSSGKYQRGMSLRNVVSFNAFGTFDFQAQDDSQDSNSDCQDDSTWYVNDDDLQFFLSRVEHQTPIPGASEWNTICDKEQEGKIKFEGNRRNLPGGKTEYLNITYLANATAREVADFYLDDPSRPKWDGFITSYKVVANGRFDNREQVVRWLRSFPMGFLSDREYIIARKEYEANSKIYAISKAIQHPNAPQVDGLVRTEHFWSMWSCEDIPCPWGTAQPACKVTLLHHEQMKINENLARFAIKQGMWGVVKSIVPAFEEFVAWRRARVGSNEKDPKAYGAEENSGQGYAIQRAGSSSSEGIDRAMSDSINGVYYRRRRMRKVASAMLLASGFVLAVNQSSGVTTERQGRKNRMHRSRTQSTLSRLT